MPRIVHEAIGTRTPLGDTVVVMLDLSNISSLEGSIAYPAIQFAQAKEYGPVLLAGKCLYHDIAFVGGVFITCWLSDLSEEKVTRIAMTLGITRNQVRQIIAENLTVKPPKASQKPGHSIRHHLPA